MRFLILRSGRHGRVSKDRRRELVFQQPAETRSVDQGWTSAA